MKKIKLLMLIQSAVLFAMLLGGCASSASSSSFSRYESRTAFDVAYGHVVQTQPVELEGQATIVGQLGGAVIGRAVGLGNGYGYDGTRRIQAAVGAVGGTIAGAAAERRIRSETAVEIVVQLDDADQIAVIQADDAPFAPGDRVRVLFGGDGSTRVQSL